jgi:Ferritin-like domain
MSSPPPSEDSAPQPAGIVERLVRDDLDRKRFLKMAGSAGAASFGAFVLAACGSSSKTTSTAAAPVATSTTSTAGSGGDIGILNYALTLEYLESSFYNEAASAGKITNPALKQFLATVQKDENAHVKLLKSALGSKAIKEPKFDFQGIPANEAKFAATAYVLENTGVHAYLGQAPNIKETKVLLTAASIVTIEARHSGAIALYLGKPIAPNGPLDNGWTAAKVLKAVKGTGFIK